MAVSVLYVNFQVYDDVDRSLNALIPYLAHDDEVVVADNASDSSRLAWLLSRHPRVHAIPIADNRGFAAGVNVAAHHSTNPFILLLNPDTLMQGPVVRDLERWLRDHPDTGVAGPRVLNADGTVQASARRFPRLSAAVGGRSSWLTSRFPSNWISRRNLLGLTTHDPIDVDWIAGSCLMTTREAFDRAGGLDEQFFLYWEDADYCRRLLAMGLKSTYVPGVSVEHAGGHSANQVPSLAIRAFHASALRLHLKHGGPVAQWTAPLAKAAMHLRMAWYVWRSRSAGATQPVVSDDARSRRR